MSHSQRTLPLALVSLFALGACVTDSDGMEMDPGGGGGTGSGAASTTSDAVVYLNRNAAGVSLSNLANERDVCPSGWAHLGGLATMGACTSNAPGVVVMLNTDTQGRHLDMLASEAQ